MISVLNKDATRLGMALACVGLGLINGIALAGDDECVSFDELARVDVFDSIFSQVIETDGSLLYLGTGIREADVYDISDVNQPILLGGIGVGDHFRLVTDISAQDGIAYVSTEIGGGFAIVDMSDPASPVTLSQIDELFTFNVIAVGNLVYTVGHFTDAPGVPTSLFIIDVADPSAPLILSSTEIAAGNAWESKAVDVHGHTVYIPGGSGGLIVLDASDPSAPVITGSLASLDRTMDVQVVGTTAYIADGAGGLRIVDVSDASSMSVLGEFAITDTMVQVQVINTVCYVTLWDSGVIAFDVSDPSSITIVGTIPLVDPDSIDRMTDVAIQGGVMFTVETSRLRVFAVDDHCIASCDSPADLNTDGDLNFFDVTLFIHYYIARDPRADLTSDGLINFHDISTFLSLYQWGCR